METASGASARRIYETVLSSHVSYLAQTRMSAPVILYSPECVYGAVTAESQLSLLGRCGVRELVPRSDHIQLIGVLHPCVGREPAARTIRP